MFLNSIVGEMNKVVIDIEGELFRRESQVPLFKEIEGKVIIQKNPDSDVELSPIN